MSKNDTMDLLRRLDPTATDDPADQVGTATRADLLSRITATEAPVVPKSTRSVRRRLVPVLAAAVAVAVVTTLVVRVPGDNDRPEALSFTAGTGVMTVRVLDPEADSKRFNEEFKQHGLDIELKLLPASPSEVGRNVGAMFTGKGGNGQLLRIKTTMVPATCEAKGTYPCVPEFTIPLDFSGEAKFYIGRAAKPGEEYASAGFIDGRGEALAGVKYLNQTVGAVLKILEQRGFTAEYRVEAGDNNEVRKTAPSEWFVHDGVASTDHHVILSVGPDKQR
jgi:hypothetical protein